MSKVLRRFWSDDDIASMIRMREVEFKTWTEIDAAFNRTHGSSANKYEALRRGARDVHRKKGSPGELWSQDESIRAAELWVDHFAQYYGDMRGPKGARERALQRIADDIGRSLSGVSSRFEVKGATFGGMQSSPRQAPAELVADRESRQRASNLMSLTATFFGDPPPGYSALDRRGQ